MIHFLLFLLALASTPAAQLRQRYIVSFHAYAPESRHLLRLSNASGVYHRRRSNNPARDAPTDFVLAELEKDEVADLEAQPFVRRVARDRRVSFSPLHTHTRVGPPHEQQDAGDLSACGAPTGRSAAGDGFGHGGTSPAKTLGADVLWRRGVNGSGINVAVLDTGSPRGRWGRDVLDFTGEGVLASTAAGGGHHHGAAVAGIISSTNARCPGMAPGAILHQFKVFTVRDQISYTSFFLDALNMALDAGVDIVNLSVGGPDAEDLPFLDKVRELTAQGALMVSAIGNDGPVKISQNTRCRSSVLHCTDMAHSYGAQLWPGFSFLRECSAIL